MQIFDFSWKKKKQETREPQICIPTWQQSAKPSSDGTRGPVISRSPQSPPLPVVPTAEAFTVTVCHCADTVVFLWGKHIVLGSLLFQNGKSGWIQEGHKTFLRLNLLSSSFPLGISVCMLNELLFLLDHHFPTKEREPGMAWTFLRIITASNFSGPDFWRLL